MSILGQRIVYNYQDSAAIVLLPLCYSLNHFVHFIYLFFVYKKARVYILEERISVTTINIKQQIVSIVK